MENYYCKSAEETLGRVGSSKVGLSHEEVLKRQERYGKNALTEGKKKSILMVFLQQFKDLLVIILVVAAVVSAFTDSLESTLVILAVILLNAVLGTVQHVKAEKSLSALKALSSPSAKVMRDGVLTIVRSSEIVPGDVIVVEAGDLIVADGRIIENHNLQVNESSLTGESTAVDKNCDMIDREKVALGDQLNMVFSGSLVTYGRALMVVTAIGMRTEIGKIAALMNATKEKKTPLQKNLDQFSKVLAVAVMAICALVFGITLWRGWEPDNIQAAVVNSLMFAVALAVAAIPEALSSIVTIVQAVGTQKMAKENAIIKDLKAVESLGSVSIICSDKTGTLTQNKMTVQNIYVSGKLLSPAALQNANPAHQTLLHTCIVANDSVEDGKSGIGDPTEVALTRLGAVYHIDEKKYRAQFPRIAELPFDSDRKLMSVLQKDADKYVMLTKGAIDVILKRTRYIFDNNHIRAITPEDLEKITQMNTDLSNNGLRVLAMAMKRGMTKNTLTLEDECDFTFLGMVSMIDPPREESAQAVSDAIFAGIKPIMITGDHKITAQAIARQIGIMREGDVALEGLELDGLTDEELDFKLASISVYARVSPEHKIRIVEAWQRRGNIVAMTGDGVNDAPALKKADIGVAMGITGTEVSKDAASMILADDNFATIVKSVTNGRGVYTNIRNAVIFLLSGNIAGIFCILLTTLIGWSRPFETVHLLFINLLTDSLPAIAIGMEPASNNLLSQKPRDPKAPLLGRQSLVMIGLQGALISAFTMIAYIVGGGAKQGMATIPLATTMAFATISLARLFHGFNCRGKNSILKLGIKTNMYQVYAFIAGVLLLAAALFVPGVKSLFMVANLSGLNVLNIVVFAISPTIIIQIVKTVLDIIEEKKLHK